MKVCFFGWKRSFDYHQVGGTESYIRRLAEGLIKLGHEVFYVMYGSPDQKSEKLENSTLVLFYEKDFKDIIAFLEKQDIDLVISIYVHPKYRPLFMYIRSKMRKTIRFATILFSPFRSKTKLTLSVLDLHLYDTVFVVSKRIQDQVARFGIKSKKLDPPISECFFNASSDRLLPSDNRIRIGYLGRADWGKGFDRAVAIMKSLDKQKFNASILTYSWPERDFNLSPNDFVTWGINLEITHYRSNPYGKEEKIASFLKKNDILLFPYRTLDTTIDVPLSIFEALSAGAYVALPDMDSLKPVYDCCFLTEGPKDFKSFLSDFCLSIYHEKNACLKEFSPAKIASFLLSN